MTDKNVFTYAPSPDYPGWHTWNLEDPSRFNGVGLGPMLIRPEGERSARLRLIAPGRQHSNVHDKIHGGITLALIDVAMFAGTYLTLGADTAGSVTLDLHNQFIGTGRIGEPLDAVVEVMKETRRLVFLRGTVEQDEHLVASFVGTLRKPSVR
ncbi:PaaI family thioesterase [Novosphingobium mangrovi (ex Huang et al. 2023)]|uniref:PaaI family thioesterase n=1 Tax=Novosphingobium mangrovi (ex Huang et al. 2023) TaxID=2976432 RepID=A0ABT2I5W7_9SPHN|nr:PaaI family thioesterase [Novosphingobium mangrovi (ex Huang et al. 2023)]MCT2399988.1 PaaI family thioesterase [Novosphingobium mangrovi (ex Huang et al. 2023)]